MMKKKLITAIFLVYSLFTCTTSFSMKRPKPKTRKEKIEYLISEYDKLKSKAIEIAKNIVEEHKKNKKKQTDLMSQIYSNLYKSEQVKGLDNMSERRLDLINFTLKHQLNENDKINKKLEELEKEFTNFEAVIETEQHKINDGKSKLEKILKDTTKLETMGEDRFREILMEHVETITKEIGIPLKKISKETKEKLETISQQFEKKIKEPKIKEKIDKIKKEIDETTKKLVEEELEWLIKDMKDKLEEAVHNKKYFEKKPKGSEHKDSLVKLESAIKKLRKMIKETELKLKNKSFMVKKEVLKKSIKAIKEARAGLKPDMEKAIKKEEFKKEIKRRTQKFIRKSQQLSKKTIEWFRKIDVEKLVKRIELFSKAFVAIRRMVFIV